MERFHDYVEIDIFITKIESMATTILYPIRFKIKVCTLMLLTNLAEVDWVSVSCDKKNFEQYFMC